MSSRSITSAVVDLPNEFSMHYLVGLFQNLHGDVLIGHRAHKPLLRIDNLEAWLLLTAILRTRFSNWRLWLASADALLKLEVCRLLPPRSDSSLRPHMQ